MSREELHIEKGRLGPIAPADLEIRPLTVLVGEQGTGKSLLAQVLYLFRALPELIAYDRRQLPDGSGWKSLEAIRRIADGLRSRHRRFANLTNPNVTVRWTGPVAVDSLRAKTETLGFNTQFATRAFNPRREMKELAAAAAKKMKPLRSALFVPTERIIYSAFGPASVGMPVPLLFQVFVDAMEDAGRVQDGWKGRKPDTEEGRWIDEHVASALAGRARRSAGSWRWSFRSGDSNRVIDLDMASSGQRANWPLALLPAVLFSLRAKKEVASPFTLYVEEPEIHLHPQAEWAVIEALAYMVSKGFRVVMTTHSLTALYVINNILLAGGRKRKGAGRRPAAEGIDLAFDDVAAYHLHAGEVTSLRDEETRQLDESALGQVADRLAAEMNRLWLERR